MSSPSFNLRSKNSSMIQVMWCPVLVGGSVDIRWHAGVGWVGATGNLGPRRAWPLQIRQSHAYSSTIKPTYTIYWMNFLHTGHTTWDHPLVWCHGRCYAFSRWWWVGGGYHGVHVYCVGLAGADSLLLPGYQIWAAKRTHCCCQHNTRTAIHICNIQQYWHLLYITI